MLRCCGAPVWQALSALVDLSPQSYGGSPEPTWSRTRSAIALCRINSIHPVVPDTLSVHDYVAPSEQLLDQDSSKQKQILRIHSCSSPELWNLSLRDAVEFQLCGCLGGRISKGFTGSQGSVKAAVE